MSDEHDASDPEAPEWRKLLAEHPWIASFALAATLLGALLGYWLLSDDWSAARRIAAGAFSGAGVVFLLTATRLLGSWQ